MRVKRLVTNRSEMAPERSNKKDGKGKESQPPSGEWTYNKCSNNDLLNLVSEGLLQGKDLINWRLSFRQSLPMENVDETISFYHFAERGLLALSLGNMPVTNIFPTNSPPISLDGKTIGSTSETMPSNSLKERVSPLSSGRNGTPSPPRGTWTKSMSC
jgi:hypothetical protein